MNILDPAVLADLALDLSDPDSEISQFIDHYLANYVLELLPEANRQEMWDEFVQLKGEAQIDFLNQLQPDFMAKFKSKLQAELVNLFKIK